jgi:hypothetical protein
MAKPYLTAKCTKCNEAVLVDMTGYEALHKQRVNEAIAVAEDSVHVQYMDALGLSEKPALVKDAVEAALLQYKQDRDRYVNKLERENIKLRAILDKQATPATQLTLPLLSEVLQAVPKLDG